MAKGKKQELTPEERLAAALVPEGEQPYEVPGNWVWTRLDYVAKWGSGGTPSRKRPDYYIGNTPWIKTGELNDNFVYDTEEKITQEAINESSAKLFPMNTIIIAMYGATIGKTAILGVPSTTNQACACGIPFDILYFKYLFYYVLSQKDAFIRKSKGGAQPNISQEMIKAHYIPLPPLAEQQRIVEHIESLFEKLDRAKELAQSALDSFETRKAAILHKAFTGGLTAKWREENGVGMESWEGKKLKELGSFKLGKMLDRAKNKGFPTRYLRNINVRWFDFDLSDIAQIAATEDEKKLFSVEEGDLFICEGGEPGRCAVWEQHGYDLIYQKALHRFRSNGSVVSKLLAYFLLYTSKSDKLSAHFTGTTIKHLTGQSLAEIDIFIPKIPEQEEIVHILDRLFANEQRAKELCNTIEKIDLLKKAILARAFRGELGTNNLMEESSIVLLKETLFS